MSPAEITSRANPRLKELKALSADPALRAERGLFVCEGFHLLEEAVKENFPIRQLFFDGALKGDRTVRAALGLAEESYSVQNGALAQCSSVKTPQGVIFCCEIPKTPPAPGGQYIALDGVSDPGNAGTILRSADAFGLDGVYALGGADVYSPKAVRSALGAHFRLPVRGLKAGDFAAIAEETGVLLYCAAADGENLPGDIALSKSCIIIGSEAAGVSAEAQSACAGTVRLPMAGRAESLNAAVTAGIFCYLFSLARIK